MKVPDPDDVTAGQEGAANHLFIPSLLVSAPVVPQGVTSTNEMSLPDDLHQVGLLDTTSALDAASGPTVTAGAVTAGGSPGARPHDVAAPGDLRDDR